MRFTSILLAALLLPTSLAQAAIVNGDFATGDLTGWETYDPADFLPATVLPGVVESNGGGGFQARFTATQPPAKAPAQFGELAFHATTITQTFTLVAPATIAIDYEGFLKAATGVSDVGRVSIQANIMGDATGNVFRITNFDPDYAPYGLGEIDQTVSPATGTMKLPAGTYTLAIEAGTESVPADNTASASAELIVHQVYLLPIPEPATGLLLAIAAPAIAAVILRRRKAD